MTILMSRNFDYFLLEISNYDSSSFLKRLCGLKTHPLVFSPYFVPSEISGIRDQLFGAAQSSGSNESPAFISGAYQASACKSGRFGSNPVTPGLKIGALSAFIPAFSHCTNEYSAPTVSVALYWALETHPGAKCHALEAHSWVREEGAWEGTSIQCGGCRTAQRRCCWNM